VKRRADEEKDFEDREDEDRTGHIYYALRKIRRWLDSPACRAWPPSAEPEGREMIDREAADGCPLRRPIKPDSLRRLA